MKRKKLTIYLAGAIEAAGDLGFGWRKKITPFLESLGFDVLDPCLFEPHQLRGLQPNRLPDYCTNRLTGKQVKVTHWHDLKLSKEPHLYKRFVRYMRWIIRYDIDVVTKQTDVFVMFWNRDAAKGAGSHHESGEAFLKEVPVYIVADCEVPAWTVACATEIFDNFEDLKAFLKKEYVL